MPVIRRILKDGEPTISDKIDEQVRLYFGMSKDNFYNSTHTGELVRGFLSGLAVGCGTKTIGEYCREMPKM